MQDHYKSLQIRRTATQDEVRAAYVHWAKQLHPDANPNEAAHERFLAVKEAYEVLGDPERRRNYDAALQFAELTERQRAEAASSQARVQFFTQQDQAAPARPRTDPDSAAEHAEMASRLRDLMKTGRYRDAESTARGMLAKHPRSAEAWGALGDIARSRGKMEEAAKDYAYAAQFDPSNLAWERLHREMLSAADTARPDPGSGEGASQAGSPPGWPFAAFGGVLVVLACWIALDRAPVIGQLTFALLGGLFAGGLAAGVCLSAGDVLDRFFASQGSSTTRIPPAVTLGVIALLNFWLAAAIYCVVGMAQSAFNRSLSWAFGAAAAVAAASSLAALVWSGEAAFQAAAFGASLCYAGVISGWLASDSLRANR